MVAICRDTGSLHLGSKLRYNDSSIKFFILKRIYFSLHLTFGIVLDICFIVCYFYVLVFVRETAVFVQDSNLKRYITYYYSGFGSF